MSKNIKNIITKEGFESFKKELEQLKSTGRKESAEAIKVATEQGDLSENAEYDAAKETQALLEKRIFELEEFLKNCEIADLEDNNLVNIGKTITLIKKDDNQKFIIKLVGNNEADPSSLKVSIASPVGYALLHKEVGQTVDVQTPKGLISYTIKDVTIS